MSLLRIFVLAMLVNDHGRHWQRCDGIQAAKG